jgi:putative membrane protein
MLHSGALGALLTLAPAPWYRTTLADQQLGGLLMWVPAAGVYLVAAMMLGYDLLRVKV